MAAQFGTLAGLGQAGSSMAQLMGLMRDLIKNKPKQQPGQPTEAGTGAPANLPDLSGSQGGPQGGGVEESVFDKSIDQAQKYGQIAQLLGGVMESMQGPQAVPTMPIQPRTVPGLTPSVQPRPGLPPGRGIGMGSGNLGLEQLLMLLAQRR